jgi:hypothetical protein
LGDLSGLALESPASWHPGEWYQWFLHIAVLWLNFTTPVPIKCPRHFCKEGLVF